MAAVIKRVGQITHYSMSTGIASPVDWGNLSPGIVESLLPTIANGFHDLPLQGYGLGVGISRHHAGWITGAHAVVFYQTRLAGAFTVALAQEDADVLWKSSEAHYLRFTDRGLPDRADWVYPKMPERAPWVASFPIHCTAVETSLLPRLAGLWAMTLSKIAIDEMNGCA